MTSSTPYLSHSACDGIDGNGTEEKKDCDDAVDDEVVTMVPIMITVVIIMAVHRSPCCSFCAALFV